VAIPTGTQFPQIDPNERKKRMGFVALLLVVVAGLAASAGLVLVNRGDDTAIAAYTVTDTPQAQPVFEERGARGDDPFFPLERQVDQYRAKVESDSGASLTEFEVAALDESVKTGLFGGTEENTCDPERLISFLYANPDLGEVWAGVHNIEFSEIADYVRSLDIRILAEDSNVLNHGFDPTTGGAYEIDTILEAGTAVLVDADGVIRTRCYCGNPVKPKPPQAMPPRCVVYGAQVFTVPGGDARRDGAPTDVVLTGNQAAVNGGTWVEISWGAGEDQTGWTQSINLRNHYCPPAADAGMCPGPGVVDVYADPNTSAKVGELNGTINGADASTEIAAPISRVGGPGGVVVENGFVLIRFIQPSPSLQNSAWVQVNQLDADDCKPIAHCINTEGPAKARAGGLDVRPAGVYKVEFTGHFTADRSSTEVRFLDGGAKGWITNFYTALPWTDCEDDPGIKPVVKCVRNAPGTDLVTRVATPSELADIVANVRNVPVTLVGDLTPTNGRVEIQAGPGGPIGWIEVAHLADNDKYCTPTPACLGTSGAVWSIYKDQGVQLPGTPGDPSFIDVWDASAVDINSGEFHILIEINGQTGWLNFDDVIIPDDRTCGEPVGAACPSINGNLGATAEEKVGGIAEEAGIIDNEAVQGVLRESVQGTSGACCLSKAVFDSDAADNEQAVAVPTVVTLTGTTNAAGTWFEIGSVYPGKWAPAVNFIDPAACKPTPPDNCGTFVPGTVDVPYDACCINSKVVDVDGRSMEINPAQFAEYVRTVSTFDTFIYEMTLFPEGTTIFAAPSNIIGGDGCEAPTPVECPIVDGQSSQVQSNEAGVTTCCANASLDGITVVTLQGEVDEGNGDDPTIFEYLTVDHGYQPYEVFVSADSCADLDTVACPAINGQDSTVSAPNAAVVRCCVGTERLGQLVVTLEGTVDYGSGDDPSNFEYLTVGNGFLPGEVFVTAANCVDEAPASPGLPPAPAPDPAPLAPAADNEPADNEPVDSCASDRDNDGVCDADDNCPSVGNANQRNTFGDQRGDACEQRPACDGIGDADNDGVCDRDDNCPQVSNAGQTNSNQTPEGDACDTSEPADPCAGNGDRDGDGICNADDNCPRLANPNQEDTFGGPEGDVCEELNQCDADKDDDGVCDNTDNCVGVPNADQRDSYGDKRGDACEEKCPAERVAGNECCKEGTGAYKGECYQRCSNGKDLDLQRNGCLITCRDGTTVPQGTECPPLCPVERQNPDTNQCCKEGTEYYHGACYQMCGVDAPDLGDGCGPCRARGGDQDGDKICDRDDNCVDVSNFKQSDKDGDRIGDVCDKQ